MPDTAGIKDKYSVWEHGTPFKRTDIATFINSVKEAEQSCGRKGWVTLPHLYVKLNTEPWATLFDQNSILSKMLLSDVFKSDVTLNTTRDSSARQSKSLDKISVDFLVLFALLHCLGKRDHKVKARGFSEVVS